MLIWIQQFFMQVLLWLLALVDSIFGVFGALSGIIPVNAGGEETTLTSYFLSLDSVQKAFWIIFIASVGICAVCTVIAIVKSIINAKNGESKSHVRTIGQSVSTLVISLFMAIFLVVGVGVVDTLLGAVNKAINGGDMQGMSANIIDVSLGRSILYDTENIQGLNKVGEDGDYTYISYLYKFEKSGDGKTPLYYEEIDGYEEKHLIKYIDPTTGNAFTLWQYIYTLQLDGTYTLNLSKLAVDYTTSGWVEGYDISSLSSDISNESVASIFGSYSTNFVGFPTAWKNNGKVYPDSFNFLVAYLTTIIVAFALIVAAFGLVKRLFDIVLLFIVLPAIVATIPLDDGAKFKLWRETVISKVFLAFGSVLAVNVFFMVAPWLWTVNINGFGVLANTLLKVFLICGGALTISGGQLLFARLLGTSAEESREMGQSARTLFGGAMAGFGLAKAAGRGLFGYRNANGQRVGGLIKGGAGALGTLGGGAANLVGNALGGQAYRNSRAGRAINATQQALKGFGSSAGWFGGGSAENKNLGYGISQGMQKLGGKLARSGAVQKSGLVNGLGGLTVGNMRRASEKRHAAARQNARDMIAQGSSSLAAAQAAAEASPIRNATKPLQDDFGREVVAGFEGGPSTLPAISNDNK